MPAHTRSESASKTLNLDISRDTNLIQDVPHSPITSTKRSKSDNGLLDPDSFRRLSTSTLDALSDDGRSLRTTSRASHIRRSHSPIPPLSWTATAQTFWARNRGLLLVSLSQLFGALMNVLTRSLELEGSGMDPFQILFARMGITMLCCIFYMWWASVPYFPFGQKGVRKLLVARGLSGFFGIFGMYYSLQYLPIADATVITFLAPGVAAAGCWILLGEPFTRKEMFATLASLMGVVLIARPTSFFDMGDAVVVVSQQEGAPANATGNHDLNLPNPTPGERLGAIGVALVGVLGAAGAYTTIRWIGKRAHPLISVNYFATWCTIVSFTVLTVSTFIPSSGRSFKLPNGLRQWAMLFGLGTCGFIMQFMLTAGLSHEKSNRANNMVYTQMLFALLFDRWFFGTVPTGWSLIGSALILGSAVYVAVQKAGAKQEEQQVRPVRDEEVGMLDDDGERRGSGESIRESEDGRRVEPNDDRELDRPLG